MNYESNIDLWSLRRKYQRDVESLEKELKETQRKLAVVLETMEMINKDNSQEVQK